MSDVRVPLFTRSQWHDCKNTGGTNIPPYGIAEVIGTTTIDVGGQTRPAMDVQVPNSANPEALVFTGPTGVPAGKAGICHNEGIGYAAHDGALNTALYYGVDANSSLLVQRNGDFIPVGDTFVSSGNNVSLFYKRAERRADKIQFTIVSVSGTVATVFVDAATCGATTIPGITAGTCLLTVNDTLGCLLDKAAPEDWVGVKGMASRLQNVSGFQCEANGACYWAIDALCCPPGSEV